MGKGLMCYRDLSHQPRLSSRQVGALEGRDFAFWNRGKRLNVDKSPSCDYEGSLSGTPDSRGRRLDPAAGNWLFTDALTVRMEQEDAEIGRWKDWTLWCWPIATAAQMAWAVNTYRKGYAGDSRLMPFKAFAVASLFVGAGASAVLGSLQASGLHKVEDFQRLGSNIRTGLGFPLPRNTRDD